MAQAEPGDLRAADWPGWRGVRRDGMAPWLPDELGDNVKILWQQRLTGEGLAGIAATGRHVIVADRDPFDQCDVFRCLQSDTGEQLWQIQYLAPGRLDYGNSPRATPLIHEGKVYLLGAFGNLHCVRLADGTVLWKRNLVTEFQAKMLTWGMSASPLIVDEKLIVNPGSKDAALAALDPSTGHTVWQTPGGQSAYASFIVGRFGGVRQIVGYDAISLGGWDPATGKRLWHLLPPERGDFNVPTPIDVDGKLLVMTENNGTRLYGFDDRGKILSKPLAVNADLAHDTSTPIVLRGKVFGCFGDLFCLDLNAGLKRLWSAEHEAFEGHVSIIGHMDHTDGDRMLIASVEGELLLVRANRQRYELISSRRLFDDGEILSHPALVGRRLFIRGGSTVYCIALDAE